MSLKDILGDNSEVPLRVRNWYKRVADKFLKPLLLRPEAQTNDKMLDTFEVLQTQDAMLLVKGKNLMVPDITLGGEDEKGHVNPTFVMVGSSYQQGRKESQQKNTLSTGLFLKKSLQINLGRGVPNLGNFLLLKWALPKRKGVFFWDSFP